MAKKRPKSITERINELIYKLDEVPPPDGGFIKGRLSQISELVEALEEGSGIRDAEKKVETLEQRIATLELQLNAANAEIKAFRAERKKQEDEKRRQDIDDIQFQILERLGSPGSGQWLNLGEISRALKIEVDEAEVYIEGLDGLGLIFTTLTTPEVEAGFARLRETGWLYPNAGLAEKRESESYTNIPTVSRYSMRHC